MDRLSRKIADELASCGAVSQTVMSAPAWQEDQQSPFLKLTSDTFLDVLGWRPRMVAMHFVPEAGFFVQHYPGIQIASIGPRIVEPHSASERMELKTIDDIWQVLLELLKRMKTVGASCFFVANHMDCFRYSKGVIEVSFLKYLQKNEVLGNSISSEISRICLSVCFNAILIF